MSKDRPRISNDADIDRDFHDYPITKKDIAYWQKYWQDHPSEGVDMRFIMGKVMTTEEWEKRRQKILDTPLP